VVVGGWVPDLLIEGAGEEHVGSIDVDLALDAKKLMGGRYAELLGLLIDTRRYFKGEKSFQLYAMVDLQDGEAPVRVDVEFLAPQEINLRSSRRSCVIEDFRVLQADGCAAAFHAPEVVTIDGQMVSGARNRVQLRVASFPDFLVMKCFALKGRDKPKDAYDLCYCLGHVAEGMESIAEDWKGRKADESVRRAIEILREKFDSVDAFGPRQVVGFLQIGNSEEAAIEARRACELVQRFLVMVE